MTALLSGLTAPTIWLVQRRYGPDASRRFASLMACTLLVQQGLVGLVLRRRPIARGLGPIDLMTLSRGVASALLLGSFGARLRDRRGPAGWLGWCGVVYGAIVCDWLDGPLARRMGTSEAGAIFDLEGDSWLTLCTAAAAVAWGGLPRFVVLPALMRYPLFFELVRRTDYERATADDPPWARRIGIAQMALFLAALAPFGGRLTRRAVCVAAPIETVVQLAALALMYRRKVRR